MTENEIETFCIGLLEKQGYEYLYAPDIAPDSANPLRSRFEEVLLSSRLSDAVARINPAIPHYAQMEAIKEISRLHSPELLTNNESFHRMLTEGVPVSYQKEGSQRGDRVWLVDFEHPENNDFVVANQFTVIESGVTKRPDVVLFVNGLPLVVIELKNAVDENASVKSAYQQLQTYKATIPSLFTYNGLMIVSDGLEAKAGSLSAGLSRFMSWKTADGKEEASHLVSQLEILIKGMLNKATLLDLIRHFIVFEKSKTEDPKTGVVTIETVKKLAAYHQYYAVNRAVESTLRATGHVGDVLVVNTVCIPTRERGNEAIEYSRGEPVCSPKMVKKDPASYGVSGVKNQPKGDRKGGVVWHTQGSGKSLSMVFFYGQDCAGSE